MRLTFKGDWCNKKGYCFYKIYFWISSYDHKQVSVNPGYFEKVIKIEKYVNHSHDSVNVMLTDVKTKSIYK